MPHVYLTNTLLQHVLLEGVYLIVFSHFVTIVFEVVQFCPLILKINVLLVQFDNK